MAFRDLDFGLLVRRKPREAKRRIVEMHDKCAAAAPGRVMLEVARRFGVDIRTLNRWVLRLGIRDELRAARYGGRAAS